MLKYLSVITAAGMATKLLGFVNLIFIIRNIDPVHFANYSAILSVASLLIPILSFSFDSYLPLLSFTTVQNVVGRYLSLVSFICICVFIFIFVFFNWIYAVCVILALSTIVQNTLINYSLSKKDIRKQVVIVILFGFLIEATKFVFVFFKPFSEDNLLLGALLGAVAASVSVICLSKISFKKVKITNLLVTKKIFSFITHRTISVFIQNGALQLLPLYIYSTQNTSSAALTFMAVSLTTVLFQIIGRRYSDFFNFTLKRGIENKKLFIIKYLVVIAIIIIGYHSVLLISMYFFSDHLPTSWQGITVYYKPFVLYSFFQLTTYPIFQMLVVLNKSKVYVLDAFFRIVLVAIVIVVAELFKLSVVNLLWLYSISLSVYFLLVSFRNLRWLN